MYTLVPTYESGMTGLPWDEPLQNRHLRYLPTLIDKNVLPPMRQTDNRKSTNQQIANQNYSHHELRLMLCKYLL